MENIDAGCESVQISRRAFKTPQAVGLPAPEAAGDPTRPNAEVQSCITWSRESRELDLQTQELSARIAQLQHHLSATEVGISRFGLDLRASAFEDWDRLEEDARKALELEAMNALLVRAFESVRPADGSVAAVSPALANMMQWTLVAAGIDDHELLSCFDRLTKAEEPSPRADATRSLLARLQRTKDMTTMAHSIASEPTYRTMRRLTAIATVLSWALRDCTLELLVGDLAAATVVVYDRTFRCVSIKQLESLLALNERDLKSLQRQWTLLQHQVRMLQSAKRSLLSLEALA